MSNGPTEKPMPLFRIRRLLLVAGAEDEIPRDEVYAAVERHVRGDWGEASQEERTTNDDALLTGRGMLVSVFRSRSGLRFWVHTTEEKETFVALVPDEWEEPAANP